MLPKERITHTATLIRFRHLTQQPFGGYESQLESTVSDAMNSRKIGRDAIAELSRITVGIFTE